VRTSSVVSMRPSSQRFASVHRVLQNTGMATQLRDYRIRAGELDTFVDEWTAHLAPLRRSLGFAIPAAWTVPDEHRFIWLLEHPDGWDAFEAADVAYFAAPERSAIDPDPARLIEEQRTLRLTEVPLP
jgi:hypothetical protein